MDKKWKIPVTWEMSGFIKVSKDKCPTLKEAMKYATSDEVDLPDGEYVDSSFRLTHEMEEIEVVREAYNNTRPTLFVRTARKKDQNLIRKQMQTIMKSDILTTKERNTNSLLMRKVMDLLQMLCIKNTEKMILR